MAGAGVIDGGIASVGVSVALGPTSVGSGLGLKTTAARTAIAPTSRPAMMAISSQRGRPPDEDFVVARPEAAAAAVGGGAARSLPHLWQNVRPGGLPEPQWGQTVKPAWGGGGGSAALGGGAAGGAARTSVGGGSGAAASVGCTGGGGSSVGGAWPSHSRNAPQEPQNWSPAAFTVPQRLQTIVSGGIGRRLSGRRAIADG